METYLFILYIFFIFRILLCYNEEYIFWKRKLVCGRKAAGMVHISCSCKIILIYLSISRLQFVLHNWADSECLKILGNCRESLPEKGKMIIVERILPETPDEDITSKLIFNVDLVMLAYIPNARERTEKEFQALAKQAGFKEFRKVCSVYTLGIMEFFK